MGKAKRQFWGLDFETSGTSHERHVPIQLGIAAPDGSLYSSLIGGWAWADEMDLGYPVPGENCWLWDLRAYEVHGIDRERLETAPDTAQVAASALDFVEGYRPEVWHGQRKLVGWNVASFDVPFLRKHFSGLARKLSYQSVDLNAVCFAISRAHGISFTEVKARSKEYAAEQMADLFPDEMWHDAGYDALAALHSFDYLTERIKEAY